MICRYHGLEEEPTPIPVLVEDEYEDEYDDE